MYNMRTIITKGNTMSKTVENITKLPVKIKYFVWGLIDGEHKSFYVSEDKLEKFMNKQKLSMSTKIQIKSLKHCQGLELDKGFTIERRYSFNNQVNQEA